LNLRLYYRQLARILGADPQSITAADPSHPEPLLILLPQLPQNVL